jgi:hypothetical protein
MLEFTQSHAFHFCAGNGGYRRKDFDISLTEALPPEISMMWTQQFGCTPCQ